MALKKCSISMLVLNAVRFGLFAAWLALTGMKVAHFLSEPTVLQSRVDGNGETPYITVIRAESGFTVFEQLFRRQHAFYVAQAFMAIQKQLVQLGYAPIGSIPDYDIIPIPNQTLLEYVTVHSMTLCELSGRTPAETNSSDRKRHRNITATSDEYGNWTAALTSPLDIGATLTPNRGSSFVQLRLPHYNDSIDYRGLRLPPLKGDPLDPSNVFYLLVFHSQPSYFQSHRDFQSSIVIKNATNEQTFELTVQRLVKINLKREPCEEDPTYDIAECRRKCLFDWLYCTLYESQTDGGKPVCMASDLISYGKSFDRFFFDKDNSGNVVPVDLCRCPQPCILDHISYSDISNTVSAQMSASDSGFLTVKILASRQRETKVMVLTYGLEDLLADMGGYLGLLLGASLLSVFGSGRKLTTRLVRQALAKRRRRRRRQAAKEEEEQNDTATAGNFDRDQAARDDNAYVSVNFIHPDFFTRFVQQ